MPRETCIKCEKIFIENLSSSLDDFWDLQLWQIPEMSDICVKCFVRIASRYL